MLLTPLSESATAKAMEVLKSTDDPDLLEVAHRLKALNDATPYVNRVLKAAEDILLWQTKTRELALDAATKLARVFYPEL